MYGRRVLPSCCLHYASLRLPYVTRRDNPGYQVNSGGNILLDRFRYEVKLMGKRVILPPILVMVGFALLAELLYYLHTSPARMLSASLEMLLPLAAGIAVPDVTAPTRWACPPGYLQLVADHSLRADWGRNRIPVIWLAAPSQSRGIIENVERGITMKQIPIFLGVLKYEFKMQIRRRSLWFVFASLHS